METIGILIAIICGLLIVLCFFIPWMKHIYNVIYAIGALVLSIFWSVFLSLLYKDMDFHLEHMFTIALFLGSIVFFYSFLKEEKERATIKK